MAIDCNLGAWTTVKMYSISLLVFLINFVRASSILDNCEAIPGFGSSNSNDVSLQCNLRTINSEFDRTNLSGLPGDSVVSLRLECSDVLFYQSSLEKSSLAHLPRLTNLHIEHCKLSRLPPGIFAGLSQLRNLTIRTHNTAWPALSLDVSPGVFNSLHRLEKIDFSSNNIWTFPENSFCSLSSLRVLDVGHNRLQDLNALSFTDQQPTARSIKRPSPSCPRNLGLEVLDVSRNRLILLPPNGLAKLNFLNELYLQGNEITIVSAGAFSGLKSLKILNLADNKIENLPSIVFDDNLELSEIYLQNNSLSSIRPGTLSKLNHLVILDLSKNKLTSYGDANNKNGNSTFGGLIRLVNLNLSHNKLTHLSPDLFADLFSLQVLNLEHNEIEIIEGNAFSMLKNLHTLTLSHNKLTFIDSTTFNGLIVLTFLSLDNNLISEIHSEAFHNNSNVRDINLNGNSFSSIPLAIQNLTFLKTLDLGENSISDMDVKLSGLPNLYGLRLTGNQIFNVTGTIFKELPSLKVINLARNQIHSVAEGSFDVNTNLQAVRLDANYLTDISGLFANLPNLLWLNVSDNRLTWFDYSLIPSQLMWLDLHRNHIGQLENNYGRTEFRLQTLDVSFNRLTTVSAATVPDSLENLYMNDNLIKTVEPNTFYKKANLTRVDLFSNQIETLELSAMHLGVSDRPAPEFYVAGNPFICDCRLEWLPKVNTLSGLRQHPIVMDVDNLYCRLPFHQPSDTVDFEIPSYFVEGRSSGEPLGIVLPISQVGSDQFLCSYKTHCFNLCHCCDFEACDCQMTCPSGCDCYHDNTWSVNIVDCSSNGRTNVPNIPMDSTEVHLDGNQFGYIPSHVLIGRKNLEKLFLNNSGIDSIMNNSFSGLKRLDSLHLEDNFIREIRGYEFEPLEGLRELYLQRNQISFIASEAFVHLKNLEVINLTGNRLTRFAIWSLSWNPYLRAISLTGNPWSCDCEFIAQALPWVEGNLGKLTGENSSHLLIPNDYVSDGMALPGRINLNCVHNGKSWPLLQMNLTYCSDSNSISTKSIGGKSGNSENDIFPFLPSALAIGAVLLFVSSVFLAVCRHRKWWALAFGRTNCDNIEQCYANGSLDGGDADKLFDAYIAYSVKDEAWVSQILATNLQQQHLHRSDQPYRLCLHYRDFVMTAFIADTIIEAVESSKRTVIVLSKNFLQSEWCSFEFKSALHTAIRGNMKNRLVIVTLGDISTRDLDPDLRVMLRYAVVLEANDKLFWAKLKNSLPEPRPVSTSTWRSNKRTLYDVNERNNWLQPGQFPQLHCQSSPPPPQLPLPIPSTENIQPMLENLHNSQCSEFVHHHQYHQHHHHHHQHQHSATTVSCESDDPDKTHYTYVENSP